MNLRTYTCTSFSRTQTLEISGFEYIIVYVVPHSWPMASERDAQRNTLNVPTFPSFSTLPRVSVDYTTDYFAD